MRCFVIHCRADINCHLVAYWRDPISDKKILLCLLLFTEVTQASRNRNVPSDCRSDFLPSYPSKRLDENAGFAGRYSLTLGTNTML
jgi:hypothetical protein